jgi:hypothetical protein
MIGHSDISMTDRYAHLSLDHHRATQEPLRKGLQNTMKAQLIDLKKSELHISNTKGKKHKKRELQESCNSLIYYCLFWSGREDLNLRPLEPHSSALPVCATPRQEGRFLASSPTGVKEAKAKK